MLKHQVNHSAVVAMTSTDMNNCTVSSLQSHPCPTSSQSVKVTVVYCV